MQYPEITPQNLSIVLQGPICREIHPFSEGLPLTEFCVLNYRRLFADAEIIVSTWKGEVSSVKGADKVVSNEDPGELPRSPHSENKFVNINRQIVSTWNGLSAASRTYAIKCRTDTTVVNPQILIFFSDHRLNKRRLRHLQMPIVTSAAGSRCPVSHERMLFHPSDMIHLGLCSDLLSYWSARKASPEDSLWQINHPENQFNAARWLPEWSSIFPQKLTPEQFLFMEFLGRTGASSNLCNPLDGSLKNYWCSEREMIRNFLFWPGWGDQLIQPERLSRNNYSGSKSARADYEIVNKLSGEASWTSCYLAARMPLYVLRRLLFYIEGNARKWWLRLAPAALKQSWRNWRCTMSIQRAKKREKHQAESRSFDSK